MRSLGASLVLLTVLAACSSPAPEPEPAATPAGPQIQTQEVDYTVGDTTMKGFLAWDASQPGPHPGILVVHEWWGLNDYARSRARQLAELSYTALALDMYGDGKTTDHPDDAGKFSSAVMADMPTAEARFEAARSLLVARPEVDPAKIGAIGYCFGGGVVLHMASVGSDLQAVASFHGALQATADAKPGTIKAKILVAHGADDPFVPAEAVDAFKAKMDAAGADYQFVAYEGAVHGFTNPAATEAGQKFKLPLAYNEAADEQSWQAMKELFARAFTDTPADAPAAAGEAEGEAQ